MADTYDAESRAVRGTSSQVEDTRSLGDLFAELMGEVSQLVQKEVQLAKTELSATASRAGKEIAFAAAGALLALSGFLVLLLAIANLLNDLLDSPWLGHLIVGLVVLAIGGFLVKKGIDGLKTVNMAPQQTVETLKELKELKP